MKGARKCGKPLVVVQVPGEDGRLEHHRIEAESASAEHLREALGRIIAEPTKFRIGFKEKPTFKGHTPKLDGEVMPDAA